MRIQVCTGVQVCRRTGAVQVQCRCMGCMHVYACVCVVCMCAGACLPPCILGLARVLGTRLRQAHVHPLILAVEVLELRAVGEWRPACVRRNSRREHTHCYKTRRGGWRGGAVCAPRQVRGSIKTPRHACRQSTPRRRPFQRAGVTDELPPRVGPFALRRHGTMLDRTEAYVESKPDTCGAHKASADSG